MAVFHDEQYLNLVRHVLDKGVRKSNRTGTDTVSVFGYQMRFDLRDGTIPLLTSKKMHTRSIIHEILWYLQGADNTKYLKDNKVTIWDEWADENGNLGPVYGKQWRQWLGKIKTSDVAPPPPTPHYKIMDQYVYQETIDQIAELITRLKTNPHDRRMIVTAWNVADLPDMALPPCHYTFQCYAKPMSTKERIMWASKSYYVYDLFGVPEDKIDDMLDAADVPKYELSLMLNQRSCDIGLGVPFNIVQYSILLRMIAEVVNMAPGDFVWNGGDAHIYVDHFDGLHEQLNNAQAGLYESPTFRFARGITDIDDFKYEDFIIDGYKSWPTIKMDVAV